ncbi:L-aminoadipate-semialdehyde dehydrogenase [Gigaspora margarita]|uniref:Alpha-aminoadipate reductase n=2 Tax=Gigaspora margarita TaxID=4874 RepID=A0A8H4A1M2_GIGMA|nr:L-aminoadipate-semialdehyde dehydrogenase [Gigaspora margarita]
MSTTLISSRLLNDPVLINKRLDRWKQRLRNLTELQLPTDYVRPLTPKVIEDKKILRIPEATALAILQLSLAIQPDSSISSTQTSTQTNESFREQPTPFTILLAAFVVLLHRYTGDEDITVGSSSDTRNPLVLRISIDPSDTFAQVIQKVQQVEREATADEVPFHLLISSLFPEKDLQGPSSTSINSPLFRVRFFNQTDLPENPLPQAISLTTDLTVLIASHSSSSLRHALLPAIEIQISYNQLLFSEKRISHILDQLAAVINYATLHSETCIAEIPILTDKCLEVIPNPKSDLKWSQFRGAITDVFSANAKKIPNNPCVVVSTGDMSIKRIFTYRHINEASNLVAHHLIKNGIEREDVVMIYAYRGVDLVIAIMGVLKAGATFSVIDPAYPPERQNVYLSVAVPSGLIILKHSGTIHPLVRTYIQENLNLKCEIPALEILDDGFLKGGNIDDQGDADILDVVRDSASKDVGVIIGPDSIGTLSFTSGSTGTPKGVRGRHFSLTHYYPWMSEKFGISDKDRFTMLSGIAHDPIQRDIFTPLFFGAELHIPTSEDIGVPGRLAEWMAEHEVTITHLTPAMGQLLSANATAPIPKLRNTFFVGDILTKRDCNRLQRLAPNTSIINMYGTTETQRSVSYFLIPSLSSTPTFLESQKDIMPAGKGMQNVQLLVVNRRNKNLLCGVGEIGELYVRAGGLAEGYLRLDEVTNEKFLKNWFNEGLEMLQDDVDDIQEWKRFWKGKRDRLYKTGDLGRYRPNGDVECVGRVDDQVKIRGFRIELGEIDTHLSQHPLVRENVTLVRRDKYEEQTLVCYFVPLQSSDLEEFLSSADENDAAETMVEKRKYNRLIKQIKDYLKMKLPSYSIPSVFVPLKRMPLTPNGKIDKQALPFPDTAKFVSTSKPAKIQKMSQSEQVVHEIWTQLLPNPSTPFIPLDDNFFDLGGHSLLATRLIFELRKKSGVNIPLGLVYEKPTIREQANEIDIVLRGELNIVDENTDIQAANSKSAIEKGYEMGKPELNYADDVEILISKYLLQNYSPIPENYQRKVFFVTGVTGFLGAFILSDLLSSNNEIKIIAHVRAETKQHGMERLKKSCKSHLVWRDEWESEGRVEVICGDLEKERLGINEEDWKSLCESVDVIVHNGALVHWVYPYPKLKSANVIGTLWCINLASIHHSKPFIFVSSTSVLDTRHYVSLSDSIIEKGEGKGISENDDLEGSRFELKSGYGQSKWVAEKLTMEAKKRGLNACIVRPGYIVGDSKTGVTNTDDFIWRLIKGCIQLKLIPTIHNTLNMCPVDYVAHCITVISLSSVASDRGVFHITHPKNPSFRFLDLFNSLILYGYNVTKTEYIVWRNELMEFTLRQEDNALYPLLHFVLDDLPTTTKSPELDDTNTGDIVGQECMVIEEKIMGIYLGYLVKVGFIDKPEPHDKDKVGDLEGKILDLPDITALEGVEVLKRSGRN